MPDGVCPRHTLTPLATHIRMGVCGYAARFVVAPGRYAGMGSIAGTPVASVPSACERCGVSEGVAPILSHHRNGLVADNRTENKQLLCHRCHRAVHDETGIHAWPPYERQERWKERQGESWKQKRAAYMRAYRSTQPCPAEVKDGNPRSSRSRTPGDARTGAPAAASKPARGDAPPRTEGRGDNGGVDRRTRQERWKRRQGDAWRKHRAAYMRAWRARRRNG